MVKKKNPTNKHQPKNPTPQANKTKYKQINKLNLLKLQETPAYCKSELMDLLPRGDIHLVQECLGYFCLKWKRQSTAAET